MIRDRTITVLFYAIICLFYAIICLGCWFFECVPVPADHHHFRTQIGMVISNSLFWFLDSTRLALHHSKFIIIHLCLVGLGLWSDRWICETTCLLACNWHVVSQGVYKEWSSFLSCRITKTDKRLQWCEKLLPSS